MADQQQVELPFHQKYLPLKLLAEGSYGQVILAATLKSHVDEHGNAAFVIDKPVAIKVFKYPEMPEDSDTLHV